jgi:hypothetical protein
MNYAKSKYCFSSRIYHNKTVYSDASCYACGTLVKVEISLFVVKCLQPKTLAVVQATGKFRNCNDWQITRNLLQQLYSM